MSSANKPWATGRFVEEQVFPRKFILLVPIPAVLAVVAVWGESRSGEEATPAAVVPTITAVSLAVLVWMYRMKLITTVSGGTVNLRFQGLFKTRSIEIREIESAEAREYRPLVEYGGWGIKGGKAGWAYNVHGNRGVQLKLRDGKHLLIGSQRPGELEKAITSSPQYNPTGGYSSAG